MAIKCLALRTSILDIIVSTTGVDWGHLCISLGVNLTLSTLLGSSNVSLNLFSKLRQRAVGRVAGFSGISHVTVWTMMVIKPGDLITRCQSAGIKTMLSCFGNWNLKLFKNSDPIIYTGLHRQGPDPPPSTPANSSSISSL